MKDHVSFLDIFNSIAPLQLKVIKVIDHFFGALLAFIVPATSPTNLPSLIKKILIVRPGGIGDAVFLLPIIHQLHQQGIEVDVLCERRNVEVFQSQSPSLGQTYCYDKAAELGALFKNHYDVVVDTEQWHYLSALTTYFIKAPYKIGFNTRPLRGKLFNNKSEYGQNIYELENFLMLFKDILLPSSQLKDINGSFLLKPAVKSWAEQQIKVPTVGIFLGGSISLRRLKLKQILDIIRKVRSQGFNVVLLGGKDVLEMGQEVLQEVDSSNVQSFIGKVTLEESAGLISQCKFFIGTDSGLLHIACAVGTRVIGIFGPGNVRKWGPRGAGHQVISKSLPCAPCTVFGYTVPTCQHGYQCIDHSEIDNFKL